MSLFLPVNSQELKAATSVARPDFVLVTGDAYVDHPSFGAAVIARVLADEGFSVGIIALPDWKSLKSFQTFGKPRLAFLVTGGNIDSMVSHYSVAKKARTKDAYAPGGQAGLRPDRAAIVYGNKIRECYKDSSIILGGLEASLRRLSHYDYWDNKVRRSVLLDASADLLVYGMGEKPMTEIAHALNNNIPVASLTFIKGTVYKAKNMPENADIITLPTFKAASTDKKAYAESFRTQLENADAIRGKALAELYPSGIVVQNPPAEPLSQAEFDRVYSLPYAYEAHPMYAAQGGVPAIEEVKFSLISSRGCFGGCNFCALSFHQGRILQSRSHHSLLQEAVKMTKRADFKGYIHDVGGPTANFRAPACGKQAKLGACARRQCLFPSPCKQLNVSHDDYLSLLRKLRKLPKIKKVFVRSGLRFDYIMADKDGTFLRELCEHHVSGQLKVAPEHVSAAALHKMGKPGRDVFTAFAAKYAAINAKTDKKQFLVPYFMSSHPGADLHAAIELAEFLRDSGLFPEQAQDFYPTPGTLSTAMYHTGLDPRDMSRVYVAKKPHEKAMQRALLQYRLPQNHALVLEALKRAGRTDLIGFGKKHLVRPRTPSKQSHGKR